MKKLLLFFLFMSNVIYAQPPIAQPSDIVNCDYNGDGVENFYLLSNNAQILNGLSPTAYSITFYQTLIDAQNNVNQISTPTAFLVNVAVPKTIYVRVKENANPANFATTNFNVVLNFLPVVVLNDLTLCTGESGLLETGLSSDLYTFQWSLSDTPIAGATSSSLLVSQTGFYKVDVTSIASGCVAVAGKYVVFTFFMDIITPEDFIIYEDPFDNYAEFNLNANTFNLSNGTGSYTKTFHTSLSDANNGTNAIVNIESYTNISNPQTLYIRIQEDYVGCFVIREITLSVQLGNGIVNIPDFTFKTKLLSANSSNTVAKDLNGNWTTIDTNQDGNIQISEAQNVSYIDATLIPLFSVTGINHFVNLVDFNCSNTSLSTLDVSSLSNLQHLSCYGNQITELPLPNNNSLLSLNIMSNPISVLNLNNNVNITTLWINSTLIQSLDIGALTNLNSLGYSPGVCELLNFNNKDNITTLNVSNSTVTSFDFSLFPNITQIGCSNSNLSVIDLSQNSLLTSIYINSNSLLEVLNLKNGGPSMSDGSIVDNSMDYICVNEYVTSGFVDYLNDWNVGPININSYCSIAPGGDYNTISGTIKYDFDLNGCDESDNSVKYIKFDVASTNSSTNLSAFSDNQGIYNFYTIDPGTFILSPNLENPTYFNISPNPATVTIAQIDNTTTTQNFCLTANGFYPDLEIVVVPVTPARPGFDAVYKIVYKNKGNQTVGGMLTFMFNDAVLDFVSSTVSPNINSIGYLSWDVASLAPFQVGTILVTFSVNSPQEIPAVNIDDVLTFNANINLTMDVMPNDNSFEFNQIVVGSYDPNDITCLQGNALPTTEMGEFLHYNIRFENTGTYAAENIVVKNEIDLTQYNIQSLQVMESSHPMEVKVTGNIAEFIFQNIDLDTGGHGNILLKLKSNTTLSNDLVINSADIFFDYNFPIITNDEQTVFADLSKNDFVKDVSIQVYPNPANDVINVKADNTINSIQLYDAQGRLLLTKSANENSQVLDLSSYSSGIYFINISTSVGKQTQKIIKN